MDRCEKLSDETDERIRQPMSPHAPHMSAGHRLGGLQGERERLSMGQGRPYSVDTSELNTIVQDITPESLCVIGCKMDVHKKNRSKKRWSYR